MGVNTGNDHGCCGSLLPHHHHHHVMSNWALYASPLSAVCQPSERCILYASPLNAVCQPSERCMPGRWTLYSVCQSGPRDAIQNGGRSSSVASSGAPAPPPLTAWWPESSWHRGPGERAVAAPRSGARALGFYPATARPDGLGGAGGIECVHETRNVSLQFFHFLHWLS